MKIRLLLLFSFFWLSQFAWSQSWIRINQLGYLPHSVKVAVFISNEKIALPQFQICEAISGKIVFNSKPQLSDGSNWAMKTAARFDFSKLEKPGAYYILAGKIKSPAFRIDASVFDGTADFILNYMRQQQCGYNPFLKDSCHRYDGYIVDHPSQNGKIIDAKGGWHDASDYLQYVTTSANAVYQMLFAYAKNPEIYTDFYDASGNKNTNGIPDILDQVRWGLDWMLRMNPDSGVFFNQVADDRDHRGFRIPTHDSVSYGNGLYRPVYFLTGKPQGLAKYKNRTTGVSSTAGKFASSFAKAAQIYEKTDPDFAKKLTVKARQAYGFAITDLGETQTASNVSPYFYEESNYFDDLELGAWEMFQLTNNEYYQKQAHYWGALEPVTPWMETGKARHYQFYPFVNLGHANQAFSGKENAQTYNTFMKQGLKSILERGKNDPFLNGVPFIWCSNNLIAAAITQSRLYFENTGDSAFIYMESALRDWLFGCNPWGTSMIVELPTGGDSPILPHAAVTLWLKKNPIGGLIDGPVYKEIYTSLRGIKLFNEDSYKAFQNGIAVYHDDIGDYSSNEPTMDGTASLSYYLSTMEKLGRSQKKQASVYQKDNQGAIIRTNPDKKEIHLIFSADEYSDGATHILDVLAAKKIKASFFLTGKYLRNKLFETTIKRMVTEKHYVGAHSDQHLLYCTWEKRDSLLVNREHFENDLRNNYKELQRFGIKTDSVTYFLPPYEWYNQAIADWTSNLGLKLINYTSGTGTPADYTTPDMKNYKSSDVLLNNLMAYEKTNNLNGSILLIHLGTHPDRKDKLYHSLNEIIDQLTQKGYSFTKF